MDVRRLLHLTLPLLLPLTGCVDRSSPAAPALPRADLVAASAVPNPTVTGPIVATAAPGDPSHGYPFFATDAALAANGYIEQEFFIEGQARRFTTPTLTTGALVGDEYSYRTRILVRRPTSAAAFNGTVLLEWANVSVGYDLDALWLATHDHLMDRGYAWVGVSAQRVGVQAAPRALLAWSPARYGSLDVTAGGTFLDDTLSYDIFSQAAQALRHPVGVDPLGGLPVARMLAVGVSQSAGRLGRYYNSIQPLTGMFDGFFLIGAGAPVRTDQDVKVFKTLAETDLRNQPQLGYRQADSDRFRRWEVAGASHIDFWMMQALVPLQLRDIGATPSLSLCSAQPPLSRIPYAMVLNSALDHLVAWVKLGVQPPTAPVIEAVPYGAFALIVRDTLGQALGGIRLSQLTVPTAVNTGENGPPTNGWCWSFGSWMPFTQAQLAGLYSTHEAYLAQVIDSTHATERAGYILSEDGAQSIAAAARADVGRR